MDVVDTFYDFGGALISTGRYENVCYLMYSRLKN